MQVGTATDWKVVAAGNLSGYAIKNNGTLWAWGYNDDGQLGNGNTTTQCAPVQIGTDTNWADVQGSNTHAIALKTNGSLLARGAYNYGQLGTGDNVTSLMPIQVNVAGCVLGNESFESKNGFRVNPNPANGIFNIDLAINYKTLKVHHLLGKVVFNKNIDNLASVAVDLSGFSAGVYLTRLTNENDVENVKLLNN